MPKKPKQPPGAGRPSSRRDADADAHEEFWDRPRKTRREDRKSGKRRRGDDVDGGTPPGGVAEIFGEPAPESPGPPARPRPARGRGAPGGRAGVGRRADGPIRPDPGAMDRPGDRPAGPRRPARPASGAPRPTTGPTPPARPPATAPTPTSARRRAEPPTTASPAFRNPRPPAGPGSVPSRPAARSRIASGRPAGGAAAPGAGPATAPVELPGVDFSPPRGSPPVGGSPPGGSPRVGSPNPVRPRRPSGEVPSLDTRLEGLASRGRINRPDRSRAAETSAHDGAGPGYDDSYDEDAYGYDDEIDAPRRRLRVGLALLVVVAVLGGAVGAAGLWVRAKIDPSGPPGDIVTVEIEQGQSTSEIGTVLEDAGIISSATVWTWYVRFKGGGDIQAGTYDLNENMSMGQALAALEDDPIPHERSVTIAEGLTIDQMIQHLTDPENGVRGFDADRLRQAITGGTIRSRYLPEGQANPEGTLFPDTYSLGEDDDEAVLVQDMVTQMDTVLQELDIDARAQALGRSPYEILIIASMIEREARIPQERPMIARVIYNRLAEGMALGIDATSCYESGHCPPTQAELDSDSPYNTRRNPGLPPTPIAAPSRASIEAALAPADGEWMYFVVNDTAGHHTFSVTSEEHDAAVQQCREQGLCG